MALIISVDFVFHARQKGPHAFDTHVLFLTNRLWGGQQHRPRAHSCYVQCAHHFRLLITHLLFLQTGFGEGNIIDLVLTHDMFSALIISVKTHSTHANSALMLLIHMCFSCKQALERATTSTLS